LFEEPFFSNRASKKSLRKEIVMAKKKDKGKKSEKKGKKGKKNTNGKKKNKN